MARRKATRAMGPNIRFRLPTDVQSWLCQEALSSQLSVSETARRLTVLGAWGFRSQHFEGLNAIADERQLDLIAICETVHEKCRTILSTKGDSKGQVADEIPDKLVEHCIRELRGLPEPEPESSTPAELFPIIVQPELQAEPRKLLAKKLITSKKKAEPQVQFWIVRPLRHRLEQLRQKHHSTENELARRLVILARWNFPPGMLEELSQAAESARYEFVTVCAAAATVWTMRGLLLPTLDAVVSYFHVDTPMIWEIEDPGRLEILRGFPTPIDEHSTGSPKGDAE